MEEVLLALLLADGAVAALAHDRINWSVLPTQALPAISLHRIAGRREYNTQGSAGLVQSIVQVDCWGRSYPEAKTLARAVILALPNRTTAGSVILQGLFCTNESDTFEGENPFPLYRTRLDFSVWHTGD